MLGRLKVSDPPCNPMVAPKWSLLMFCIDRIKQMSSIMLPICGKRSLTSVPHWPYFLKPQSAAL